MKRLSLQLDDQKIREINDYMESRRFLLLVGILTVASNVLGAVLAIVPELLIYTAFIIFGCFIALYGRDFKPMLIVVACSYIAPSVNANPGRYAASVFYPLNGGIYLIVLFAGFIGCVIYRIVKDPELGGKNFLRKPRKLLPGMLILGVGYVLAGVFSGRYFERGIMNLFFAVLQFISVTLMYWIFTGMVRWDKVKPDYLAWTGLTVGLVTCIELIILFIANRVIRNGIIEARWIFGGWGNANNIGCVIAMMIPYAVYLGRHTEKAWMFNILAAVMVIFVCFTCSRASIIGAVLIYVISVLVVFRGFPKGKARRIYLLFNGAILLVLLIFAIIFHQRIILLFQELLNRGLDPRRRELIYPAGFKIFLENPIFGEGWYPSSDTIFEWSTQAKIKAVLPGRWHNTVIQMLASCGIVGMACYSFHRLQTIKLFWKKRNTDTIFTGLVLLALLLMSLLDCHFFNIGPTLFYSAALAFAEYAPAETMYEKT